MQFKTGKVPSEVLVRRVFRYRGRGDRSVILGSSIGEDAALVSFRGEVLVFTTDPVTGTASEIGALSVHINANDIACRGARPRWFLCDLLLPERSSPRLIETIMRQVDTTARRLGVAVVGGHTEVTPGLDRPVIVGFMVGVVGRRKYVTSHGARPSHDIIMTKSAGIEGTALLAIDFARRLRLDAKLVARAKELLHSISVVRDAMIAVQAGGVTAMHDPTEGGLLQGVWEIAEASNVGFTVYESKIAIRDETVRVCAALGANPLRLMSSGCLLIAASKRKSKRIIDHLKRRGIEAKVIGTFTTRKQGRKLIRKDKPTLAVKASERDELYRIIETHGKR